MTKLVGEDVLMCNPSGFQFGPNFDLTTKRQWQSFNGINAMNLSNLCLSNDNKNCRNFVTNLSKPTSGALDPTILVKYYETGTTLYLSLSLSFFWSGRVSSSL